MERNGTALTFFYLYLTVNIRLRLLASNTAVIAVVGETLLIYLFFQLRANTNRLDYRYGQTTCCESDRKQAPRNARERSSGHTMLTNLSQVSVLDRS
jgi:hypothetical protein